MTASLPPLAQRLAACIAEQGLYGRHLCVGYSGGLDSSVLLHLLAGLRGNPDVLNTFRLSAVHVHHGLSSQADAWAAHCADVCRTLSVPLHSCRVTVNPAGEGLEAAARAARYRVFRELDADALVLAHHRDDQAETVLLQLLRGASLKGMAAMPQRRSLPGAITPGMILLRPMLDTTRAEIAAYAAEHRLNWIDDASNDDQRLSRNALRHSVLPALSAHYPDVSQTLVQAAAQFAEAASLLDALAVNDAGIARDRLALAVLHALPEPRARNLLRHFLAQAGVAIRRDALHEALRQLLTARPDAQVRVAFGDAILHLHAGHVVIQPRPKVPALSTNLLWQGESCVELGEAGSLLFQSASGTGVRLTPGQVSIRKRLGGERMRPGPGRPRRTLKNLLREAGIPAWQRDSLPLVYLDEALVWAAGIGGDSDFQVIAGETGWLISWQAPPNTAG